MLTSLAGVVSVELNARTLRVRRHRSLHGHPWTSGSVGRPATRPAWVVVASGAHHARVSGAGVGTRAHHVRLPGRPTVHGSRSGVLRLLRVHSAGSGWTAWGKHVRRGTLRRRSNLLLLLQLVVHHLQPGSCAAIGRHHWAWQLGLLLRLLRWRCRRNRLLHGHAWLHAHRVLQSIAQHVGQGRLGIVLLRTVGHHLLLHELLLLLLLLWVHRYLRLTMHWRPRPSQHAVLDHGLLLLALLLEPLQMLQLLRSPRNLSQCGVSLSRPGWTHLSSRHRRCRHWPRSSLGDWHSRSSGVLRRRVRHPHHLSRRTSLAKLRLLGRLSGLLLLLLPLLRVLWLHAWLSSSARLHLLLLHLLLPDHLLADLHVPLLLLNLLQKHVLLRRLHVSQHLALLVRQSDSLVSHHALRLWLRLLLLLWVWQQQTSDCQILLLLPRVHLREAVSLLSRQGGDMLLDDLLLANQVRRRLARPHHLLLLTRNKLLRWRLLLRPALWWLLAWRYHCPSELLLLRPLLLLRHHVLLLLVLRLLRPLLLLLGWHRLLLRNLWLLRLSWLLALLLYPWLLALLLALLLCPWLLALLLCPWLLALLLCPWLLALLLCPWWLALLLCPWWLALLLHPGWLALLLHSWWLSLLLCLLRLLLVNWLGLLLPLVLQRNSLTLDLLLF